MKKKFTQIVNRLLLITALCSILPANIWAQADVWDGITIATAFASGDGSPGTTYEINTGAQLAYLQQIVETDNATYSAKNYKLTNDIDLNNKSWTPIGSSSSPFKGNFDGDNHIVSNLYVPNSGTASSCAGLFGYITPATNITVEKLGVILGEKGISASYTGGIAGEIGSSSSITFTIKNCFVRGSLIESKNNPDNAYSGGLIGVIDGTGLTISITNCYASVDTITANTDHTTAKSAAGGIIGQINSGTVGLTDCLSLCTKISAYASVSKTSYAGNITGNDTGGTPTYTTCYSSPLTTQTKQSGAAPVNTYPTSPGTDDKDGILLTATNFDTALTGWKTAGWQLSDDRLPTLETGSDSPLKGSFIWIGDGTPGNPYQIRNESHLRFIAFYSNSAVPSYHDKAYKLMNSMALSGTWDPIGKAGVTTGFSGVFDGDGYAISGLYMPARSGSSFDGLFGTLLPGANIKNLGLIVVEEDNHGGLTYSGGIAGISMSGTTIENCFVTGGIIYGPIAGGIVGNNGGTIKNCYTTNTIWSDGSSDHEVGGICGQNKNLIQNCYAVGKIDEAFHGGFSGGIAGTHAYGSITNCLALNIDGITGIGQEGRISGNKGNTATLAGNYASPLITGSSWNNIAADQTDGGDWDGSNHTFAAPVDVWNTTDPWLLPRLQIFIDKGTPQPADNLRKADYLYVSTVTLTQPAEGGTISAMYSGSTLQDGDNADIPNNSVLTLTATPSSGYQLKTLTADGNPITGTTYTVTANVTLSAVFEKTFEVTLTQPAVGGTISATYPGNTLTDGVNADIPNNTVLTLTATHASGYHLKTLTADGSPITGTTYTVMADVILSAVFGKDAPAPDPDPEPVPPVYHTVTLPAIEGATTNPVAGDYQVEAWSDFRFYLTLDKEYDQSEPVITTDRSETIMPRSSDGAYIIKNVRQPVEILIKGIVKNSAVSNEVVTADDMKVWSAQGYLYISSVKGQTVHIYNLAGTQVKQADIPAGDTQWTLPTGIYIVQIGSQRYKVII